MFRSLTGAALLGVNSTATSTQPFGGSGETYGGSDSVNLEFPPVISSPCVPAAPRCVALIQTQAPSTFSFSRIGFRRRSLAFVCLSFLVDVHLRILSTAPEL